jgi:uncharacterized protein YkwD
MPFKLTIRPVAVAVVAAASLSVLLAFAPNAAHAAGCQGKNSTKRAVAIRAMACLVNQARAARGLRPLSIDYRLQRVARRQAHQMVRHRFFGHNAPAGGLSQRVKRSGFAPKNRQWWCGENLGYGTNRKRSARSIHYGWMHSAIHRKAILYPNFSRMGIGIARGTPSGPSRRALTWVVTFGG